MNLWRDERGEGRLKVIITLAVIFYFIFCAVKLVPIWTNDRSFHHDVVTHIKYADQKVWKPGDVIFNIQKSAEEYDIPLEEDSIEVTKTEKEWHARVTYTWDKKLIFWNYVKPVVIDEKFGSY